MRCKQSFHHRAFMRRLRFEGLEGRVLMAVDLDDSLSEASSLGAITTAGRTVGGAISPDTDVDLYRFTVTAGQTIDFDIDTPLNGPGGLGSFLKLFNASGQQLAFNNDGIAPGETPGFDSFIRFTFATGGTYYIGVSNFNNTFYDPRTGGGDVAGGSFATGDYQLTVQALAVDTNDAIAEAVFLGAATTTPKTVSDAISPDTDVDMYSFSVAAGQTVDFDIDTPTNGPGGLGSYLRLFTSTGQQLDFNNDGAAPGESTVGFDSFLRRTFSVGGTYYIAVSNFTNTQYSPVNGEGDLGGGLYSVGSYQLTMQIAPPIAPDLDDSIPEATFLGRVFSQPIVRADAISPDTDVDMYSFTAVAGQTIDFDIDTPANGPGGLGSFLRLFASTGQQLGFNDDGAAPGETTVGFDSYLRYTFGVSGTYYVAVSNWNNTLYSPVNGDGDLGGGLYSTGSYQLSIQSAPNTSPIFFFTDSTPASQGSSPSPPLMQARSTSPAISSAPTPLMFNTPVQTPPAAASAMAWREIARSPIHASPTSLDAFFAELGA